MNWFRAMGKDVVSNGVFYLLERAFMLLAGLAVGGLGGQFLSNTIEALKPYTAGLMILGTALAGWLTVWAYDFMTRGRPQFPRLQFDWRVLERSVVYEYLDPTHMRYCKTLTLQANKNGLTRYVDRYRWTGSGHSDGVATIPGQTYQNTERTPLWQYYEVTFPRAPRKGETIAVEVEYSLDDPDGNAVPMLSAEIVEPTDMLQMEIVLPHEWGVRKVVKALHVTIGGLKPLKDWDGEFDHKGHFKWVVQRPKLLHDYRVRWGYDGVIPKSGTMKTS